MEEIVISATSCSEANSILVWDLLTGRVLHSFENNVSQPAATQPVPASTNPGSRHSCRFLVSAQANKAAIHTWRWEQDALFFRCTVPEVMKCTAVSDDGIFLAGGGASGRIYLWKMATGELLRCIDAHYRSVTSLQFASGSSVLLSASADAFVHAWDSASLLDVQGRSERTVAAAQSWSAHSMPVSGMWVGHSARSRSCAAHARFYTVSLDKTCKVWEVGRPGKALLTINFPVGLHCITGGAQEECLFAGADDGRIFLVNLRIASNAIDNRTKSPPATFLGHTDAVTCLSVNLDGTKLVSGSMDGTLKVWDVFGLQLLHSFAGHCHNNGRQVKMAAGTGVTSAMVVLRPHGDRDVALTRKGKRARGKKRHKAGGATSCVGIAPFQKYKRDADRGYASSATVEMSWSAPSGKRPSPDSPPFHPAELLKKSKRARESAEASRARGARVQIAQLQKKVSELQQENARVVQLNKQLAQSVVEHIS